MSRSLCLVHRANRRLHSTMNWRRVWPAWFEAADLRRAAVTGITEISRLKLVSISADQQ